MFGRYFSLQGPPYIASCVAVAILYYTTHIKGAVSILLSFGIVLLVCIVEHTFIW